MKKKENKIEKIQDIENKLWEAADNLRGNLSSEVFMHVVIGILALKFINDKYEHAIEKLKNNFGEENFNQMASDTNWLKDTLIGESAFYVPKISKWSLILEKVGTDEIGKAIDDALLELSKENDDLHGIFSLIYNDDLDKTRLSNVIKIFENEQLSDKSEDIIGRIYEFFLGKFFLKRGQRGGEFYTPSSVVKLIVNILKPLSGKIYDPACGSGGMFVQSKQYIQEHNGNINSISVYGQEFNKINWNLGKLNLIIHGFKIKNKNMKTNSDEDALGAQPGDTFIVDQHPGKKFNFIMANPPFNSKIPNLESIKQDPRWKYGIPPENNANYGWLQHILYKLEEDGKAGVVLANGSLTSNVSNEDEIRKNIIEDNKVSCIIALPDKLFYTTSISACIWIFDNKKNRDDILMINAEQLGTLVEGSKKNKELTDENISKIVKVYDEFESGLEINIPGFAKSVKYDEIKENSFSLSPGMYIEICEDEKKDPESIKQELKKDIEDLMQLLEENKSLEHDLMEAIKKLNL